MPLLIPLASVITTVFTVALVYETGKNAKRKFDRKKARQSRSKGQI
ncbi:hypothetical protein [Campylobacter geochelonis]|uniref:Uncharacterized protein n=1 Tax=Campylobacter geochelonis TaxID=1780362 RepID=A0A128EIC3_9BACT|nr:hypothetical protein [Campylobacter geochelonis]CZE47636.1 Uncharacterised protein [Campylobacter geochelonis]CZE48556.1 Uncharacterised protein [Campylobacter geochelonis]CZE51149.1 Uncharacterised protein [Campylobacter geochelonis]